ncbi:MAG: T9SS type A sorting domain-containing protein [Bacteroidetes bacterium]|nr:T9SS type A sorting domain-containing protein [Bacteroidota bacterium]
MKKMLHLKFSALLAIVLMVISLNAVGQSPQVTIIQPNLPGIEWKTGTSHLISWTDNLTLPVKIDLVDYTTNPAGAVVLHITNSVEGTTYPWSIPEGFALGTKYKIRVTSTVSDTYTDDSDAYFCLVNDVSGTTVHVEQPSLPGITLIQGSTYLISWIDNIVGTVKIRLYQGGADAGVIAENVVGSTYLWTVPALSGTNFKIRVASTNNGDLNDYSDNNFAIAPAATGTIQLIQPNEPLISWARGTSHLISWSDNLSENVKIEYYSTPLNAYVQIPGAESVSGSTFIWNIPSNLAVGTYKIRISSATPGSLTPPVESANYFNITATNTDGFITIEQPNALGISWAKGTSHLISWNDNLSENVKIEYYSTFLNSYVQIPGAESVSGTTFVWNIPSDITPSTFKIRVSSTANGSTLAGESANYFNITATNPEGLITIQQPNVGGIQWARGTAHLISWTDNLSENVKIEYYSTLLNSYVQIPGAESVSGSTFVWNIPSDIEPSSFKIRVTSTASSDKFGESANYFAITATAPDGVILINQPVGGEVWVKGNQYLLSWTDNLNENVKIELSNDGGVNYQSTITPVGGVSGTTWVWNTTGVTPGTNYVIKVSSVLPEGTVNAVSGVFSIVLSAGGTISINQPNGGEEWMVGTTHLISWDDNVAEGLDVDLIKYDNAGGDNPVEIEIANNVTGSTMYWTINQAGIVAPHSYYKLKVYSHTDPSAAFDYSNGYFGIIPVAMSVYPNPADFNLTVLLDENMNENCVIAFTDRFSQPIMTRAINASFTKELQIPTNDLPNGVYFLTITSDKTKTTKKVLVQH